MLAWNISITRQNSSFIRRMIPATTKTERGKFIAAWYANCGGLEWIEKLIANKKVICLRKGFYPGLYTGKAKNILPTIQEIPPYVADKYEWIEDKATGKQILHSSKDFGKSEQEMDSCNNEEWLRIEIWDLS